MNVRAIVTVLLVIAAFFAGAYWQRTIAPAQPAAASAPQGMPPEAAVPQVASGEPADVGVKWDKPGNWPDLGERQMRIATYAVPAPGNEEIGECAVFYFGPSQGGDADANIDRWIGQFEKHGNIARSTSKFGGMSTKLVEVEGDFLAPSGPMMESSGTKKDWILKGAIVEGPNGNVFFKFTGPKKTVQAAAKDWDGMLASLRKS